MSATRSQRIGIWIITIVMVLGTLGSFFVVIFANKNAQTDYQNSQKAFTEYQNKVNAQAEELSGKYFAEFSQYSSLPAAFDAASVTGLATEDLKIGDGEEITKDTPYAAYYIGWNPSGKVFDQSIDGEKLKSPIPGGNLIEGWNEGVIGMKMNGVRVITIPADKAYGESGSGEDIPPNTPLKFVVMVIPKPAEIPMPDTSGMMMQ